MGLVQMAISWLMHDFDLCLYLDHHGCLIELWGTVAERTS